MPNAQDSETLNIAQREGWPWLLRIPPRGVVLATLGWLVLAWSMFIATDILGRVDLGLNSPLWTHLFNDRPIEWTQWCLLSFAIVASAYLAGRLDAEKRAMASRFFLLLAIALGLMLIEEAGDIRHRVRPYVETALGPVTLGLPTGMLVWEIAYFAALGSVLLYTLVYYGRYAWRSVTTRFYLASGLILYALAAVSNGFRTAGGFYCRLGAWVDRFVFASSFPVPDGLCRMG